MKIAIHYNKNEGFSSKWIEYCKKNHIDYKIVDCYDSNIVNNLEDCEILMWHFSHMNAKDQLFAKQLTYALQTAGKKVYPDFHTAWHFDDKVGQKYLLEAIGAPIVPSYVFYDQTKALEWIETAEFPKVFKLRRGAGSAHVKLIKTKLQARKLVKKAFLRGFEQYNKLQNLKDRWYHYRKGITSLWSVIKGILRFAKTTELSRILGPEKGYVYFQDFIPDNSFDIRVVVINKKAFAIKRLVRTGDFRASGSGQILYDKHFFDDELIKLSFELEEKIKSQSLAIDYVFRNGEPLIVEISFGFLKEPFYKCEGYWDRDLNWYSGPFDAQAWMVEALLSESKTEPCILNL